MDSSARKESSRNGVDINRLRGGNTERMSRVTFRIPEDRVDELEDLVDEGMFPNRSEAIRSSVRSLIDEKSSSQ